MFGTNGVRGIVGETITASFARRMGQAVGTWMEGDTVLLGRDARDSGPALAQAFAEGAMSTGKTVIDLGLCPTPAVQWASMSRGHVAAVVTASHNPPEYNGIKIIRAGVETTPDEEDALEACYHQGDFASGTGSLQTEDVLDAYLAAITDHVDARAIRAATLRVVVDAGGGAGCVVVPRWLASVGVDVVPISCEPDGAFSDRPSEPSEANAAACMAAIRQYNADLGVLLDGDGDRAVFVDENGDYIWGDRALALAALHELPRHENRLACTAVSSSTCVEDAVTSAGGELVWTPVGSPVVAREMARRGAPFGGEDNGGMMFARHMIGKDGLMTTAFMVELLATTGKSMSTLLDDVPRYALSKHKVRVQDPDRAMAAAEQQASQDDGVVRVDTIDGLKAYYEGGWVLIRPSGTEPVVRVQAEAADEGSAQALARKFVKAITGL